MIKTPRDEFVFVIVIVIYVTIRFWFFKLTDDQKGEVKMALTEETNIIPGDDKKRIEELEEENEELRNRIEELE